MAWLIDIIAELRGNVQAMGVVCIIWLAEKIVHLIEMVTTGSLPVVVAKNVCESARACLKPFLEGLDQTC